MQYKQRNVKYTQDKINDFIRYIENQCNAEQYKNIFEKTMFEIEHFNDFDFSVFQNNQKKAKVLQRDLPENMADYFNVINEAIC